MRRFPYFWVFFLALSLVLPLSAMAQTVTLESATTGDRIGIGALKAFSFAPDGSLIVYLNGPFNAASLLPDITVDDTSGVNCVATKPASVTATQGANLSFKLTSATAGATFSAIVVNPEPGVASFDPNTKTFTWNTGGSPPQVTGSYLAVFQAQTTSPPNTSQLVVTITINPPITVTAPTSVTGPTTGSINTAISFTASGSTSSQSGDTVQYQFDWGDGSKSPWGSGTQSKTWTAAGGPYTVRAMAASVAYPSVQSSWTTGPAITISAAPPSCTSQVTAQVTNSAGGSITSTNPVTTTCGGSVSFNGTLNSGYTGVNATEGSFAPNGLYWSLTGITAPATNGGSKTVSITFTGSGPGPGACSDPTKDMSARLASAVALTQYNSDGWYGYEGAGYNISAGSEVWFKVDPAAVGLAGNQLSVSISNPRQSGALSVWEYTVDQNSCLVGVKMQLTPDRDWFGWGLSVRFPNSIPSSQKYLFQVYSNQSLGISAMFQMNWSM
jgi:hypothetical protein